LLIVPEKPDDLLTEVEPEVKSSKLMRQRSIKKYLIGFKKHLQEENYNAGRKMPINPGKLFLDGRKGRLAKILKICDISNVIKYYLRILQECPMIIFLAYSLIMKFRYNKRPRNLNLRSNYSTAICLIQHVKYVLSVCKGLTFYRIKSM